MKAHLVLFLTLASLLAVSCTGQANATESVESEIAADSLEPATATAVELEIAMVGDILLGNDFRQVQLPPDSGRLLFQDCADLLRDADLALGNLEGPIATVGKTTKAGEHVYAFQMPPYLGQRLQDVGFDFLTVGNNHAMDMGPEGSRQTTQILNDLGITYTGLNGMQPVILERQGLKIGICAFGQNRTSPLHSDTALVRRTIMALRKRCDILIVSFHGGAEGTNARHVPQGQETFYGENRGNLRLFTHLAIDCGADLIHGHGPHVLRGLELYKGRLICYSLGNFCTPFGMSLNAQCGLAPLVRVRVNEKGEFLDGKVYSFRQHRPLGPRSDQTLEVLHEMQQLSEADFPNCGLKIQPDGTILKEK